MSYFIWNAEIEEYEWVYDPDTNVEPSADEEEDILEARNIGEED